MELLLIVEGDLEAAVLVRFLQPYTQRWFTSVIPHNTKGNNKLKQTFRELSEDHLNADRENYVLCLVDMLEEPFGVTHPERTIAENFHALQSAMLNAIDPKL